MQKHTPGPRIVKQFDDAQIVVLGPDKGNGKRDTVATFTGPRRAADARLDAAAPKLLEACKAWMRVESEMRDNNPCPDIGLRIQYRIKAVALTKAAIAETEKKT